MEVNFDLLMGENNFVEKMGGNVTPMGGVDEVFMEIRSLLFSCSDQAIDWQPEIEKQPNEMDIGYLLTDLEALDNDNTSAVVQTSFENVVSFSAPIEPMKSL